MDKLFVDHSYVSEARIEGWSQNTSLINRHAITIVLKTLNQLYCSALDLGKQILMNQIELNEDALRKIYVRASRLYLSDCMLFMAMQTENDDLFCQSKDSEDWLMIQKHSELIEMSDNDMVLIDSCKNIQKVISLGNACVSKSLIHDGTLKKVVNSGIYATYYLFNSTKRDEQSDYFASNPDFQLISTVWNVLESPKMKTLVNPFLPEITINHCVFIPMLDRIMTLENFSN